MKKLLDKKGQFSIIAALLVAIVLVAAIITTYSIIRNNPLEERPQVLGSIDEMNLAINHILEFVIGYYGSILQVTGNTTYAKSLATNYLRSGLENIAYTHPHWSPSFQLNDFQVSASWFNRTSYTQGAINVTYSIVGLGISGIQYAASAGLKVTVNPSNTSSVLVNVTRDGNKPCPNLSKNNFFFYNYSYTESAWRLNNTGVKINSISSNDTYSVYNITILSGLDPKAYMVQVADYRGITVSASTFSRYTYTFTWNQTLYSSLSRDTIVVEALQNGTLRWLGQNLLTYGKPIPPIPVKALHVNQTVDGVNREVPFQVEDWGSNYRVPLGLTSNASIFSSRNMLVSLVNHTVQKITFWWDGRDTANQTSYAWKNIYFNDDPAASSNYGVLNNGIVRLRVYLYGSNKQIEATFVGGSTTSTAKFMRINGEEPVYGAKPAYVIYNGIVRDIVQQEAEWGTDGGSGGATNCPNIYSQMYFTLPAKATYYTYALRLIFVNSSQSRTITDLSAIQLLISSPSSGQRRTENGTSGGYPINSTATAPFYNFTSFPNGWAHHWSEFISSGSSGAGIMFTDNANQKLYIFDKIAGQKIGALNVLSSSRTIEFNPVNRNQASFMYPLDVTWHGAVVTFNNDPNNTIYPYPASGKFGLWVMVEHPPIVAVN